MLCYDGIANEFWYLYSIRASLYVPGTTLHPTPSRNHKERRALETNITRCVAYLRSYELGLGYVALSVVSGYGAERVED